MLQLTETHLLLFIDFRTATNSNTLDYHFGNQIGDEYENNASSNSGTDRNAGSFEATAVLYSCPEQGRPALAWPQWPLASALSFHSRSRTLALGGHSVDSSMTCLVLAGTAICPDSRIGLCLARRRAARQVLNRLKQLLLD